MTLEDQLIEAAQAGRTEDVEAVLKSGADVHAWGEEALRVAAEHGDEATVKVLLDAGADPREDDHKAYWSALAGGDPRVVELLLERIGYEPQPPGEERILSDDQPAKEKLSERYARLVRERNFAAHSEEKSIVREPEKGRERK